MSGRIGSVRRISGAAAIFFGISTLLGSCANRDGMTTGALPDDYRTRHPIVVGEEEKTIDIPIAAGDDGLTRGQSEVIAGFAANYTRSSKGIIRVMTPQGAINSGAAAAAASDVRRLLVRMGVPKNRILHTGYAAAGYGSTAPIRLAYVAITAQVGPCGEWPADLTLNTIENKNYHNFGCASQRNLAAQIADPNDLLGPRRMTPADAEQRGQAMERYRESYTELRDFQ
ncbi:MAG TPA: CpaD family pilus assembly protein [Pseudorhizobium sp.]|jgi:pilus assembly protein CpaD|nr:CpaD family pilus assembly protein [Pseudorhizobium sp.]